MQVPFHQMPADARVWVYNTNRLLTSAEETTISGQLSSFVEHWSSHENPLKAAYRLTDSCVLVLAVENGWEAASGCSIDKSVKTLKAIEEDLGISFFERTLILYKAQASANIQFLSVQEFKQQLSTREISANGLIMNTQVQSVEAYKDQLWVSVKDSWLARFIPSGVSQG